jgi:branched-chain amino acid transport system ATP-binding protein
MLAVAEVTKRFGGAVAVDKVSFTVERGQIVGLIGPNGAGKTTMFNLIAGSLAPDSGAIRLDGERIERLPAHRRLGLGLGRTFQIPRPLGAMSVLENVLLAAAGQIGEAMTANWLRPGAIARQERTNLDKAMAILDLLALRPLAGEAARVLSGGQRKLLELARVLMADPRLILLDEPAAGVNPALLETIIARIQEINAGGVTFLIVEHNMDVIGRLCGHVVVMADGGKLCEGRPAAIASDPRVVEAYLGGQPA